MVDHATPNLPSRHFEATSNFYAALGFTVVFRDVGWLILSRGDLILEFFPDANLNPASSSFGSCLRLDDLDAFYSECRKQAFQRPPSAGHVSSRPGMRPPDCESALCSTLTPACYDSSRTAIRNS